MINNWYFWMLLTGGLMITGALIERFTEWPWLTYLGVFSFGFVILCWIFLALYKNINK